MSQSKIHKEVQIAITEKCNLNCVYCYEKKKDTSMLPLETVKKILRDSMLANDGHEEIGFDFHGGEIAYAFETIRAACEWFWQQRWPRNYLFFATTNGTLIHGDMQAWFEKNKKRFYLGLSLDGTPEMHNLNRSNSFNKIDIDFFKRCWPDQNVKMTISPLTIPMVAEGVKYIHERGLTVHANLAYGVPYPKSLRPIYREQLRILADYYLAHPELTVTSLISGYVKMVGRNELRPEAWKKWCGAGEHMVCYACDGRKYPCQAFMPSTSVKNGDQMLEKFDFSNPDNFKDPDCSACVLNAGCPFCCGHNYIMTGTLYKRPKDRCDFSKIEAVAASYLYANMLRDPERYLLTQGISDFEKLSIVNGIEAIQNHLADEVASY